MKSHFCHLFSNYLPSHFLPKKNLHVSVKLLKKPYNETDPFSPQNGGGGRPNPGFVPGVHEYDVPEGHDSRGGGGGGGGGGSKVSGAVTINGITV